MENKVFLLSNRSKFSRDEDTYLTFKLDRSEKLISNTDLAETLSLYDLYNDELDNCTKYRLIVDINPICTNVLHNNITEIVKNEGSDETIVIQGGLTPISTYGIKRFVNKKYSTQYPMIARRDMVMDSEFSHDEFGGLSYKCGKDMFNNHILRATEFPYIGMCDCDKSSKTASTVNFNTISDTNRDSVGNDIVMPVYFDSSKKITSHVYNMDNIMDVMDAYQERCVEKEGWFGFENKSLIDIPNVIYDGKKYTINKVINNESACSFVNMYPDKSLFTFTPKYNNYRKRLEYNWDYCITYPYKSDEEMFKRVNMLTGNKTCAVRVYSASIVYANNGEELIQFKSLLKHTLGRGSYISLYYREKTREEDELKHVTEKVKVVSIGDSEGNEKDRIFSVKLSDLSYYFENNNGSVRVIGGKYPQFYYKKMSGRVECSYYFRKFKKLTRIDENGKENAYIPKNEINKLAFAENIFGDKISQLIFTEDIDVDGLVDNLGMPVSELYLTVVKANRGCFEWYGDKDYKSENIEYSHAFGKVTSGIELPEEILNYNVHKLHNIDLDSIKEYREYSGGTLSVFKNFRTKPNAIEGNGISGLLGGISVKEYDEFYGDIVEFDLNNFSETILEKVYHRFNTAQREVINPEYFDFNVTNILNDDFYSGVTYSKFTTENSLLNVIMDGSNQKKYAGNIEPEGYMYNPHHKIKIREIDDDVIRVKTDFVNYNGNSSKIAVNGYYDSATTMSGYTITMESPVDLDFRRGKTVVFYDIKTNKTLLTKIVSASGNIFNFWIDSNCIDGEITRKDFENYRYLISVTDDEIPGHAKYSFASQRVIWRNIIDNSKLDRNSSLYGTPISNGALYLHSNLNFFLKRQDPYNEYFMQNPEEDYRGVDGVPQYMRKIRIGSYSKLIIEALKYIDDNANTDCL